MVKQGEFNRKMYDRVRKMDHGQMKDFFQSIQDGAYKVGYEDGVMAASEDRELPELVGLEDELQGIRGIGAAKARLISEQVKDFLERKTVHK